MRRPGSPNSNRNPWPAMAPHGVYATDGEDAWIAISVQDDEQWGRFAAIVGEKGVIRDPQAQQPYLEEWRNLWTGKTPLILRPASTDEVSRIMALASETETAIVPQSGNTGLVGGQIPNPDGSEVLLSLDRMTRILAVDAEDFSITVEAGATLASVQAAAAEPVYVGDQLDLVAHGWNLSTMCAHSMRCKIK